MTLSDLASFICTKVSQTEPADVLACKSFLLRRRDMIWIDQLWKDSLFEYQITVTPTGYVVTDVWLPTKQILLLPTQIALPVAVRSSNNRFNVASSEQFYRMDWDAFQNTGTPCNYRLLSPCVWEIETPLVHGLGIPADDSTARVAQVDYLSSDRMQTVRAQVNVDSESVLVATTERIDRLSISAAPDTSLVLLTTVPAQGNVSLYTIFPPAKVALVRQRIQIIGALPNPTTLRILGKIFPPTFTTDSDEPGLTGIENALIAFAQADMLERERQYGKAKALQSQGTLLLEQLKRTQVVQQAHNKRIQPDGGYGWEWQGLTSGWGNPLW